MKKINKLTIKIGTWIWCENSGRKLAWGFFPPSRPEYLTGVNGCRELQFFVFLKTGSSWTTGSCLIRRIRSKLHSWPCILFCFWWIKKTKKTVKNKNFNENKTLERKQNNRFSVTVSALPEVYFEVTHPGGWIKKKKEKEKASTALSLSIRTSLIKTCLSFLLGDFAEVLPGGSLLANSWHICSYDYLCALSPCEMPTNKSIGLTFNSLWIPSSAKNVNVSLPLGRPCRF